MSSIVAARPAAALLLVLLAACAAPARADGDAPVPAMVLTVSQQGVNNVVAQILPALVQGLQGVDLPSISGSKDVPLIGPVDWYITNLVVGNADSTGLDVSLENELSVQISGVSVSLSANFELRQADWPHIRSSGVVDISLSDSAIALSLETASVDGRLQLTAANCQADLENLHLSFHDSWLEWIYDLIAWIAKGFIVAAVDSHIETALVNSIDVDANQRLAAINYTVPVGKLLQADFSLPTSPDFPDDFFALSSLAAVELVSDPVPPPLPHAQLPVASPAPRLLGLAIDPYLLESGFFLAWKDGDLDLPEVTSLSTSSPVVAALFPQLQAAFPNSPLALVPAVYDYPRVSVDPSGSQLQVCTSIHWLAQVNGTTWTDAFTMGANLSTSLYVAAENGNATASPYLVGRINYLNLTMDVWSSSVGPLSLDGVDALLQDVIFDSLVAFINSVLSQGLPLPSLGGLELVNPEIAEMNGYWLMAADFSFSPQPAVQSRPRV